MFVLGVVFVSGSDVRVRSPKGFPLFFTRLERHVFPYLYWEGAQHPVDQDAGHSCCTISYMWMTNVTFIVMKKNQYF